MWGAKLIRVGQRWEHVYISAGRFEDLVVEEISANTERGCCITARLPDGRHILLSPRNFATATLVGEL